MWWTTGVNMYSFIILAMYLVLYHQFFPFVAVIMIIIHCHLNILLFFAGGNYSSWEERLLFLFNLIFLSPLFHLEGSLCFKFSRNPGQPIRIPDSPHSVVFRSLWSQFYSLWLQSMPVEKFYRPGSVIPYWGYPQGYYTMCNGGSRQKSLLWFEMAPT